MSTDCGYPMTRDTIHRTPIASFPSSLFAFHPSLAFTITSPPCLFSAPAIPRFFHASISSISQVVILMLSGLQHAPFYFPRTQSSSTVRSFFDLPNCRFKVCFNCRCVTTLALFSSQPTHSFPSGSTQLSHLISPPVHSVSFLFLFSLPFVVCPIRPSP